MSYVATVTFVNSLKSPDAKIETSFLRSVKLPNGEWGTVVTPDFKKARKFDELWQAKKAVKCYPSNVVGLNVAIEDYDSIAEIFENTEIKE